MELIRISAFFSFLSQPLAFVSLVGSESGFEVVTRLAGHPETTIFIILHN
jgi:hypothetical protein